MERRLVGLAWLAAGCTVVLAGTWYPAAGYRYGRRNFQAQAVVAAWEGAVSQTSPHELRHPDRRSIVSPMGKRKITTKQYAAAVAVARKAGGDEQQSNLQGRLTAAMKRRAKVAKKAPKR